MPKNEEKGKQEDEDFDDMLAEFQAADLAAASNAGSNTPATSTIRVASTSLGTLSSSSMTSRHSPAPANAARSNVTEDAINRACKAGNLVQPQRWGREGIRVRTAEPLDSVRNGASFEVL
jgi:hypothetical protein